MPGCRVVARKRAKHTAQVHLPHPCLSTSGHIKEAIRFPPSMKDAEVRPPKQRPASPHIPKTPDGTPRPTGDDISIANESHAHNVVLMAPQDRMLLTRRCIPHLDVMFTGCGEQITIGMPTELLRGC